MQGLQFLIGATISGGMIIFFSSRLMSELSKSNKNWTLIIGQVIFVLGLIGLTLVGIFLWFNTTAL